MIRSSLLTRKPLTYILFRSKITTAKLKNQREVKFKGDKVPLTPCVDTIPPRNYTKIDENTISHIEALSLVNCANKQGITILEDAIFFAEKISHINTDGVLPMYTVLENRSLELRPDTVTDGHCQKDILKNSQLVIEDYFVAPPGNIPLKPRDDLLHEKSND